LDRDALWDNLDVIDCFATDHAPHTLEEKDSPDPPPGFPGLETAVGLFLRAVAEGRLSQEQVLSRMYHNPLKIFNLPAQPETKVYIDPAAEWEISGPDMFSKCAWTPFEGMPLRGRVRRLRLRGDLVYEDGVILAPAGFGKDMFPTHSP
jgi:carbamoyl-phosphate synthase/aspartate carbamoyltransferase/dihydroorotase